MLLLRKVEIAICRFGQISKSVVGPMTEGQGLQFSFYGWNEPRNGGSVFLKRRKEAGQTDASHCSKSLKGEA